MSGIRNPKIWLVLSVIILVLIDIAPAIERHVPNQYPTIQDAIDAAVNGDTVIVAPGTYTGNGNQDIDFLGKVITVRSSELNDPNIVAATIIDCNGTETDPHRGFYFHLNEGLSSIVNGLTIMNGVALSGGAIKFESSSPLVKNCVLKNNYAYGDYDEEHSGGAFICVNSSPVVSQCVISGNTAKYQGNQVYCKSGNAVFEKCTIIGLEIEIFGGNPNIRGCLFLSTNTAIDITSYSIVYCIIENNIIMSDYMGIYLDENMFGGMKGIIRNNVLAGSGIREGYGIFYRGTHSNPTVTGNIITDWENGIDFTYNSIESERKAKITYNNLWNNTTNYISQSASFDLTGLQGNISANPLFVDPNDNDYHLLPDSPCINAGDPNFVAEPNETDIDGESRVMLGRVDMGADEWPGPWMLYVDSDAKGANNGSSWKDAYNYLQDALADANISPKPIEIRVAQGIYKPDQGTGITPGDRMAAFRLINGVTIKGGYAGFGEPNPDTRDIALYQTILSGDIGKPSDKSDNCYHVFYHPEGLNLDATAFLDGFTITGGNANGSWPHYHGGGMYNWSSSPTVKDCTFSDNLAKYRGGGMYNKSSSTTSINCILTHNSSGTYGSGMFLDSSKPILINCIFTYNQPNDSGGGICMWASDPTITNCTFAMNSANIEGGAITCWSSNPTISCSTIIGNQVYSNYGDGGGIQCWGSNPTIINCTITGNWANGNGGGINSDYLSNPTITQCTISNNFASNFGGGIYSGASYPVIIGSILYDNEALQGKQLALRDWNGTIWPSICAVSYSDLQAGQSNVYIYHSTLNWLQGNIDADPCFVDPDSNDYHLRADSPCINAGDPNYIAGPNETDMDGEQRVMLGRVDMGADEFNPFEVDFVVINKRRIGRTVFEYDCSASLHNISRFDVDNIQLEIIKTPENMRIIDPNVTFGNIEVRAGESATSIDTCTFEVNRAKAIEPDKIVWKVKCQMADTGMPIELTLAGVGSSGLEGTADAGKIGFEDLAELAGQWLRVGPAGSIPEDITGDGIINLADFAKLAGKWRGGE